MTRSYGTRRIGIAQWPARAGMWLAPAWMILAACSTESEQTDDPQTDVADTAVDDTTDAEDALDTTDTAEVFVAPEPDFEGVEVTPTEPELRRLTRAQYVAAITNVLSPAVVVPTALEPDVEESGFPAIGSAVANTSARGVELYGDAAYAIAAQAVVDETVRERWFTCEASGPTDVACARTILGGVGRLLWRRSLTTAELDGVAAIAANAATTLGAFDSGIEFGLAALLQSPHFLYRVELGEDAGDGTRRYTSVEMASRLSYFLWNSEPDEELLAAGEAGDLLEDTKLAEQLDRMLDHERARSGVRNYFAEWYRLNRLDRLNKDPMLFVHFSPDLGSSAKEQTLADIERHVFETNGDYRDLFTITESFINRKLAAVYNVPAPVREGFGLASFDEGDGRRGLLGQVSFLAVNAHPVSTSVTLRGKYIREVFLCATVDPPPTMANTAIPEPSGETPTMRDRVEEHLSNADCAGCHRSMDPIGLGLENFDGIGRFRTTDNGATIDPTGNLDGVDFMDAWDLADALREHPAVPRCFVRNAFRYANGRVTAGPDLDQLDRLSDYFEDTGYRVLPTLRAIALSPGFRRVAPITQ